MADPGPEGIIIPSATGGELASLPYTLNPTVDTVFKFRPTAGGTWTMESNYQNIRTYVWSDDANTYVLTTGRFFIGPNDPQDYGFTMGNGDQWKDTSG